MAHYAWVDSNNNVVNVSVVKNEDNMKDGVEDTATGAAYLAEVHKEKDFVKNGGTFIKTSINTKNNKHKAGGTPLRGNYAQPGGTYDPVLDQFRNPKPFASWTWNSTDAKWEAPVAMTAEQEAALCYWDEETQAWTEPPSE
jgi:hypothetical protein